CPDHFLRTKIKPLYVPLKVGQASRLPGERDSASNRLPSVGGAGETPALRWDDSALNAFVDNLKTKLSDGLKKYRDDYAAYYNKCKRANSPAMRDPNPTVILIPGLGMVAWGKDKSESRVTAEFYNCAVEVMRGAEAIDKYISL